MVRDADLGISDIEVAEDKPSKDAMPETVRALFSEKLIREFMQSPEATTLAIHTIHRSLGSEEEVTFDFEDESRGTQRFFALTGPFLDALDNGWLVAVDELDCSMHPLLTRNLVKLFQSSANKKGAQLIFTTHDTSLMDPELLRRDQIWITEKNAAGATELRSLYDFKEKSRSTEAFEKRYLAGRYGGIPSFGRTFEDLDAEEPQESKP
jgi:AAA15 family ATPase/GTPase